MLDIRLVEDKALLRQFMHADTGETAYALGDLDPAFFPKSVYWGAFDEAKMVSMVLIYTGFQVPVLTPHGTVPGVAEILNTVAIPMEIFCLAPDRFTGTLAQHYDMQHIYKLWRMVTTRDRFNREAARPAYENDQLIRLRGADVERVNAFYQQAAAAGEEMFAFSPSQVDNGMFYGIEREDVLIAAAGTHVMATEEKVAAVGNVFTLPSQRGQGLAQRVTAAVTQGLFEAGIETVVLNVKQDNNPAVRVYEKLGYQTHSAFLEGPAFLKADAL